MDYSVEEKIMAIKRILAFNSKLTFEEFEISNKITEQDIINIKYECEKIEDLYKFNLNTKNNDFFIQIRDFAKGYALLNKD